MNFFSTSNNTILELANLAADLNKTIEIYSHVKDSVPKALVNQLNKFKLEVEKEINLRES